MRDLRLIAVSEDGGWLLLSDDSDEQYRVPIDERLRAALRSDRNRLGQLQIDLESPLTPRDIQARIRAGETAEELALAAGVPIEKIRRYEGPVLAERQHAVEEAQRASVRVETSGERGRAPQLGALVAERLGGHGVDLESLEWDAWRRDDGRWQVRLDYRAGSRDKRATFGYDPQGRVVTAEDDEARWLVGEESIGAVVKRPPARRLRSVPPGGRSAAEETAEDRGSVRPDEVATDSDTVGRGGESGRSQVAGHAEHADQVEQPDQAGGEHAADQAEAEPADVEQADLAEQGGPARTEPAESGPPTKRGRRAHVPSWDEIVFGAKKKH